MTEPASDRDRALSERSLSAPRLVSLAWVAGCVDALSYLRLGGVFTANMTGNTVLLAVAAIRGDGAQAGRSALAFAGFVAGAALATALARRAAFAVEGGLLAATALLEILAPSHLLILAAAAAMGAQSAVTRRNSPSGVNVTYITGTTTSMVSRWTDRLLGRDDDPPGLPSAVWAFYLAGGLSGAALAHAPRWVGFAAAAIVAAAPVLRDRRGHGS